MRQKLSEKFPEERENICKRILSILNLDKNNSFLLYDLDTDFEKQACILNLKDEIQKIFACSTISSFKQGFDCKRPYLNIVRSILRKQGYIITGNTAILRTEDGTTKSTKRYFIFRND
jgi:hypothetical protein